jgi:ribulose-phosphate 3-epimerase
VDGGIDVHTAPQVVQAGANVLIVGAAVFEAPEGPAAAIGRLRQALHDVEKEKSDEAS